MGGNKSTEHLRVRKETVGLNHRILGEDYFKKDSPNTDRISLIEEKAKNISKLDKYGYDTYSNNQTLCQQSIDLLMYGSDEEEHRKIILKKEVLDKLAKKETLSKELDGELHSINCLSVGVGNGDITMFISEYCTKLTVIDNSKESLANIPNHFSKKNTPVTKIEISILDAQLSEKPEDCYDSIDFLHAIYPIENKYKILLIDKLLKALCSGGILTVGYNSGLKREELGDIFNPLSNDLEGLACKVLSNPKYDSYSPYALTSTEVIKSETITTMELVAGVFLFDLNVTIDESILEHWIYHNTREGNHFRMDSHQNFIFFEADNSAQ